MAGDRLAEVLAALGAGAGRAALLVVGSGSSPGVLASLLRDGGVGAAEARRLRLRAAVDPQRLVFARFGVARGVVNTFSWSRRRFWANFEGLLRFPLECCLRGRLPGLNAGDPWQQSATLVLAPAGGAGGARRELYALRETAPGAPALDAAALAAAVRRGLREAAAIAAGADEGNGVSFGGGGDGNDGGGGGGSGGSNGSGGGGGGAGGNEGGVGAAAAPMPATLVAPRRERRASRVPRR